MLQIVRMRFLPALSALIVLISLSRAQEKNDLLNDEHPAASIETQESPATPTGTAPHTSSDSVDLLIGPGDEIDISVYGAPDLSGHTRVNENGNIQMPVIGYAQVAGLTSGQAEEIIANRLRESKVVNQPQVSVYVKEYTNSGISIAGEVNKPGYYSILGPHRLLDMIQTAGGTTEKAADKVTVTRRGQNDGITLPLSKDPAELARSNVELRPGDTVVVPRAGIVYVLGEVNRPGGYVLNVSGGVTVLRVIAAAGGPTRSAALGRAKMVRRTLDGLEEKPVPLKDLLRGKGTDMAVVNDDIVYIPSSRIKAIMNSGQLVTSLGTSAIYRASF